MQVRALIADCYHTTAIEQWFSILGPEYTYLYVVLKHTPTHTYIYKLKRHQLAAQCHLETLTCHIKMCHVTFLPTPEVRSPQFDNHGYRRQTASKLFTFESVTLTPLYLP